VTIDVHRGQRPRYLVIRVPDGEAIPSALVRTLEDERVTCGWLSGGGVLADVELRAYSAGIASLGSARRIDGPVHVLALEGSIGLSGGAVSLSLRAMLGRETDRGLETLSGEIANARSVALELFVTALEDVTVERSLDEAAGLWMVSASGDPGGGGRSPAPRAAAPTAWSAALHASDDDEAPPPRTAQAKPAASRDASTAAIPQRPPTRRGAELDVPFPEQGDSVDHFAFGRADVVKSDGDRLHLKVHKDGRIREIALGMLRVSRVADTEEGRRRFKLERRM
jgi:predicted DNA-binding protein with PD1-like motif